MSAAALESLPGVNAPGGELPGRATSLPVSHAALGPGPRLCLVGFRTRHLPLRAGSNISFTITDSTGAPNYSASNVVQPGSSDAW